MVSLVGILHHELWLDESHHYLLARDSVSFMNLVQNTRYEGHPILWNILLYGITRFSSNPFWMQLLHILLSTSVVFIFLRKAPFSWLLKTLFIFGYFMIFEYNLISRNYILGVLFLFLACSIFEKRKEKFILLSLYLALAANTHLIFTVVALALFLTILFENWQQQELFKKTYCMGYGIFFIGIVLAIIQIIPPGDTLFFDRIQEIPLNEKFTKGFISLFKGLATIPDFTTIHFWNTNLLVNLSKPISAAMGLLVYFVPILLFFKNRKTLFFVYSALLGVQIFFFVTQMSATRYDGMNYIIIIMALWIEQFYTSETYKLKDILQSLQLTLVKKPIIYGLLLLQLFGGVYAYSMDFKHPFCEAKATVDYLKAKKIKPENVISVTCDGTLISPFLGQKVFFLSYGDYQSYCHWNAIPKTPFSQKHIIEIMTNYMKTHDYAVYVSTYSLLDNPELNVWIAVTTEIKIRFMKQFNHSIVRNADYYIFEVAKINPTKQ